jgi:hypothetical protein
LVAFLILLLLLLMLPLLPPLLLLLLVPPVYLCSWVRCPLMTFLMTWSRQ